ncbi:MAG: 2Fe-2S iron-sulfur cluster-binding protein [Sulfitobacter sp.]
MTELSAPSRTGLFLRSARIVTGLYLLVYVTSHLLNLSLGLVSIKAMDAARPYLSGFMTGTVTGPVLGLMILTHYLIGLWSIYKKPVLRGSTHDVVQIVTGVLVVPLLAKHAIGISMLQQVGVDFGYSDTIRLFWLTDPSIGLLQVIMLSVVWVHGCAGLFTWLRSKPNATRALMWLYPLAVAIPVVALLGYVQAGRDVLIQERTATVETSEYSYSNETDSPDNEAEVTTPAAAPEIPYEAIVAVTRYTIWISASLAALVFLTRLARMWVTSAAPVRISSGKGPLLTSQSGRTLLDVYRANDRPHANLCMGRGRCGTCAVRVLSSDIAIADPNALEQSTLVRTGQKQDVRLACQMQLRSGGALQVEPVYPPDFSFAEDDEETVAPNDPLEAAT